MGLHRFSPTPSGRMGILWTLSTIQGASLVEFGSMGHMLYARRQLNKAGVHHGCKLFSTHIDESDIALGGTNRLTKAIEEIIDLEKPRVIFLLPSSVPEIIGTDLDAYCEELSGKYSDVKLLPIGYGGFNIEQHRGVQETLLLLTKALPVDTEPTLKPTFNIIGSCADFYRFKSDAREIIRLMDGAFGMKPLCTMTSNTSIEDLEKMGGAHINLVLRQEGILAAQELQRRFSTPYLFERPYGVEGTKKWLDDVAKVLKTEANHQFIANEQKEAQYTMDLAKQLFGYNGNKAKLSIGGHIDIVEGILSYATKELGMPKGTCWCNSTHMGTEDIPYFSESQWVDVIESGLSGLLMASGEVLKFSGRNSNLEISYPSSKWHMNPYENPFVGFRGAVNLASLWVNEILSEI